MSSPVRAILKDGGGETRVQYSKQDRSWTFIDANKATQKIKNITGTKNKTGMNNFFDNTDAFGAQKYAGRGSSSAEKKRQKTARERQNLGASPASSATPGSELVPSKQMTRQQTRAERETPKPRAREAVAKTLFGKDGKQEQEDASKALSASTTDGSKSATTPQVLKLASTPAPAPASAPPAMRTVTVDTPPILQAPNAGKAAEQVNGGDDDDVSSQLGLPLPETGKKEKTPDRRNASIQTGVGQQALQQQNQPSPLAQENAAPTGFQGAAPAPPMRSASGPSNVIHKVAVQRISAAKGIPFETYRQAYMQSNGAEVESMSDNELYQSSVDLCDQGIDTVKIKKPRFTSGRANLIREFIELNVLYNMAKPKEAEQGSKLAMLLDASNMGISAEHMMQALKGSVGGADGHIKQNAALHLGTGQPSGPPAGSPAALDYADKQKQQEKNKADAGLTMGDSPNALNVKNTASYTSTTMHGKRIEREFIMDRLRFDNNFSQDTPVTETTFHFKKKAPESRKLIRF